MSDKRFLVLLKDGSIHREKIQSLLNRVPVFFADKDCVRARSDRHGFVIPGRVAE